MELIFISEVIQLKTNGIVIPGNVTTYKYIFLYFSMSPNWALPQFSLEFWSLFLPFKNYTCTHNIIHTEPGRAVSSLQKTFCWKQTEAIQLRKQHIEKPLCQSTQPPGSISIAEEEVAEKREGSHKMEGSLFYFFCKIITLGVARIWFDGSCLFISHLLLAVTQLTEWKEQ